MAGFRTHLAGGFATGAFLGLWGYSQGLVDSPQAAAVFVLGAFGGLLPDLDSDTGKPLEILFGVVSVLIPALAYPMLLRWMSPRPEMILCYFTVSYLTINYGVCSLIKKCTIHRGMMHSVPFVLLAGGLGYLLFARSGRTPAALAGFSVFAGGMVHLFLDEASSFTLRHGFIPAWKRSKGSALKWTSDSWSNTVYWYFLLALVAAAVYLHPHQEGVRHLLTRSP